MGELQEAEVTEQIETTPVSETAGGLLRQSREAAGMPVATLAEVMKVPVAKLRALEADEWQAMPDMVFARSLVLSICKTLHVDAAPIMALMPKQQSSQKFSAPGPGPGINEPFRMRAVRSVRDNPNPSSGWKWLGFAALVAVGGGAWYFSQQEVRDAVVASVQERSDRAMGNGANAPAAPVALLPSAVPEAEPVAASAPDASVAAVASLATVGSAPTPVAMPAVSTVAAAPQTALPAAAVAAPAVPVQQPSAAPVAQPAAVAESAAPTALAVSTLRIQASAATWIQVRAGSKVLEQKTLNAGEFFETQAPKPLSVVVGRADAATVSVGGAAFDLAGVARENVARFEVK